MPASVKLLPAIAWFIVSFILLTLPGKSIPSASWMDHLPIDKLVHIFMFFVLVTFFFWGIVSTKPGVTNKQLLVSIAFSCLLYGIIMEFVQKYFVSNRSFDVLDIGADGIGSFLPLLFVKPIKKLFKIA